MTKDSSTPRAHFTIHVAGPGIGQHEKMSISDVKSNFKKRYGHVHQNYVWVSRLAQYDLQRRDLFRPAAYIHASPSVCTSALLRLRTQTSCHIPSHCKLGTMNGGRVSYRDFRDRHCHACPGACGDSAHYLTACPVTDQTILDTHRPVTNLLRQLRLPKWSSLPTPVQLSILAGSTLPTIWKSTQAGRWHWTTTLTPHAALLALRIDQQLKMALPSNL